MKQTTKNPKPKQTKQQTKKNVQEKSTQQKKKAAAGKSCSSCGCCKWLLGSIVLLAIIIGVLRYDTNTNGKGVFANSATGKMLKNAGLLPYVETGYVVVMTNTAKGYKWAEGKVPVYVTPAKQLISDLYKLGCNAVCQSVGLIKEYSVSKWPAIASKLEQYVPGLPTKLEDTANTTRGFVTDNFGKISTILKEKFGPIMTEVVGKVQKCVFDGMKMFSEEMDAWAKRK